MKQMNRKKMVDVADEVMKEVDLRMEGEVREHFERSLAYHIGRVFMRAGDGIGEKIKSLEKQQAIAMVQPVLDDVLNKIMKEKPEQQTK